MLPELKPIEKYIGLILIGINLTMNEKKKTLI